MSQGGNAPLQDEQRARRRLNRLVNALPVFSGFMSPDGHLLQTRPPTQEAFLWALPMFAYSHDSITQIVDLCETASQGERVQVERPYLKAAFDPPGEKAPYAGPRGEHGRGLLTLTPITDADGYVDELAVTLIDCDENGLSVRDERAKSRLAKVNQRIGGLLSLAQTVVEAMVAGQGTPKAVLRDRMADRLDALALMIDPLADPDTDSLPMAGVIDRTLSGLPREIVRDRLTRSLAPARLPVEMAPIFALTLSELASNARQHGAWSGMAGNRSGHVTLECETLDSARGRTLRLHWIEDGGPAVSAVLPRGFGLTLAERLFPQLTGGTSVMLNSEDGLSWTLEVPVRRASPDPDGALDGGFDGGYDEGSGGGNAA